MSTSVHPAAGSSKVIDNGYIHLLQVIGTGAYGVVYLAADSRYGQPVYRAVKCMRRHGLDARQQHFQRREIGLHRLASAHPSVISLDRIFEEGEYIYVVMEYGEEGDLFAMITDRKRYVGDDELIRDVFLQLLDGVAWMHSLGISHRDIKPENIVCSQNGTRVRICDFGLATSEEHSSEFGCGSTFYIAPECLGDWFPENRAYPTRSGDIWSLGVILVNLVCGRNPWRIASPSDESFNSYLSDPNFLRRILPISTECLFILNQIFTINPAERITLAALRKLILEVDTFSMGVEELRNAHIAAQAGSAADCNALLPVLEDDVDDQAAWLEEEMFAYDEVETPSLRGDSDSPRYPSHISPSNSDSGDSLPPTPNLLPEGNLRLPSQQCNPFWEVYHKDTAHFPSSLRKPSPIFSYSPNATAYVQ
ncbi:hypothetical protein IAT38_005996 [Cryptococcus sp. DSM 104549]